MIEVRIPLERLVRFTNEIHAAIAVLDALREAGVPVVGAISVRGVTEGTLSVTNDVVFGEQVWTWSP